MKLFPRHRKILAFLAIYDKHKKSERAVCENLLWQGVALMDTTRPCQELKKKGLIEWKRSRGLFHWPSGWVLTEKGRKLCNSHISE